MSARGLAYPLDYLYFRVWAWWSEHEAVRRRKGYETFFGDDGPIAIVALCLFLNAIAMVFVLHDFAGVRALDPLTNSRQGYRLAGGALFFVIWGLLYLKYAGLTERDWNADGFAKESSAQRRKRGKICLGYIVCTVVVPLLISLAT